MKVTLRRLNVFFDRVISFDVNDDAHVGHRSTSVKTDHTTSIGALIVMDARSTALFPMAALPFVSCMMYQMVHIANGSVKAYRRASTSAATLVELTTLLERRLDPR